MSDGYGKTVAAACGGFAHLAERELDPFRSADFAFATLAPVGADRCAATVLALAALAPVGANL